MKAKRIIFLVMATAILALNVMPVFANGLYESELWAGRDHTKVGMVLVDWWDGDTIRIRYETDEGCYLVETHVAVADSLAGIPQTQKGNPKIGHFPYAMEHDPPVTEVTYYIDVAGPGTYYIAAHAVVSCGGECETAWGQGDNVGEFPGNSWALYFWFS